MKKRQFIILLVAIFLQPIIIYFWFGYWSQHIALNQVSREQITDIGTQLNRIEYNTESIKDSTNQTLEITAKTANGIY